MDAVIWIILIVGIITLIIYMNKRKRSGNQQPRIQQMTQEEETRLSNLSQFMLDYINENKQLPEETSVSLNLKNGEIAHLVAHSVALLEQRSVSVSNRGGGAVRVARGLYLGGSQSVSRRHDEFREIDRGELTFTNKRIIFIGGSKTKQYDLKKIIHLDEYADGFAIAYEGKERKPIFVLGSDPSIWSKYLKIQNDLDNGVTITENHF